MANSSSIHILFFVFITSGVAVSATVFTLKNNCPYTVWPGTLAGKGPKLGDGGFQLTQGASQQFTAPAGWSGRFWARTGCNFDAYDDETVDDGQAFKSSTVDRWASLQIINLRRGNGKCVTGDCGDLKCNGGGAPPATLAEFTLVGDGGKDFYDVSLVDGYNVKLGISPSGGSGDCKYAGCVADLNAACPNELKVMDPQNNVVACKSACAAFNSEEYCCTGAHSSPQTCPPTSYSMVFKQACPDAYSYAYDDETSTFTCTGANYDITFCP